MDKLVQERHKQERHKLEEERRVKALTLAVQLEGMTRGGRSSDDVAETAKIFVRFIETGEPLPPEQGE